MDVKSSGQTFVGDGTCSFLRKKLLLQTGLGFLRDGWDVSEPVLRTYI